jgi:mannose-6-phosphate isomerase-like protein (cupin superfamily)
MPRRIILSLALATAPLLAQSTDPTVHTAADLQQREAKLMTAAKANPNGLASETTDDFGTSKIVLVVRVHTGLAERHQFWADQMVISTGTITLVTGGAMQEEKPNGASLGETTGSGIQGGKEVVLHAGDIAHVPAGVPHWVKLAPGATTTYIIFKDK